MDPNERLARELFGWHRNSEYAERWYIGSVDSGKVASYNWHPDCLDAQADMVVEAVAKLGCGYTWEIRTYAHSGHVRVVLWDFDGEEVYRSVIEPGRNGFIVAAAIAALDAEKSPEPEPHRCKDMVDNSEWRKSNVAGCWDYIVSGNFRTHGRFCHRCGHDLNKPDKGCSDD